MSKTRDTGFLANVIQVHDTGVRIMSGSEMLMAISSSGAVTITGELSGSDAANSLLLGGTGSVGFTTTGSFSTASGSASSRLTQIEQVYATTGSNSFRATQSITGSLTVTGQIIAQTLNVQQVTSSIIYSSGSNVFGCDINSRQTFTGSFYQTGSIAVFNSCVGIGLSNPTNRLEVQSGDIKLNAGASRCTNIFFGLTGTNYGKIQYSDTDGSMLITTIGSGAGYDLNLGTQCTTRLTILGDGKVGIGTSSPLSMLHVNCCVAGGASTTVARFGIQDSTGYGTTSPAIELTGTNIGLCFTIGRISGINDASSGGSLAFSTGLCAGTVIERMRISSTGIACFSCQVCTGAGLIANTLTISCNSGDDRAIYASLNCSTNYNSGAANTIARSVNSLKFLWYNNCWEIGATRGDDTAIQALVFAKNGSTYLAMTCHGIACFACQVCTPSGVKFGSGTTTLNYYEEGNWTPTFSNSSTTPSYLTQFGRYTRIGRVVHVVGKIGASNLGSGTVYIGGLPFSSADANDAGQRVSPRAEGDWSGFNNTTLFTSTMFRASGTTFIGVRDGGGYSIYADHSSYGSTLYFNFHATYYV